MPDQRLEALKLIIVHPKAIVYILRDGEWTFLPNPNAIIALLKVEDRIPHDIVVARAHHDTAGTHKHISVIKRASSGEQPNKSFQLPIGGSLPCNSLAK